MDHLGLSLSIIQSSETPLADDQLAWSSYRMPKPISQYTYQKKILPRVMEFCGMGLSASPPMQIDSLCKLITENIPDLDLVLNPASKLSDFLKGGVKRQCGDVSEEDKAKCDDLAKRLLESLPTHHSINANSGYQSVYRENLKDRVWQSSIQKKYSVIFIPHSAYHVWTISLLKEELTSQGIDFITLDISAEWRDGGVRRAAEEHDVELLSLSEYFLGIYEPKVLVVFNDWDPITRPILLAAKASGIRTVAIVEGIQDYDDVDVHWQRHAYKTADLILLPGDFDKQYFKNSQPEVLVTGVPRIHELRRQPKRLWSKDSKPCVLINCNFSYGVLEHSRDAWLTEVVQATLDAEMTPVISKHPGDKGKLYGEYTSEKTFYELLETCVVSVQRFASGILEALAREVGVIYYNPHGEKVDKFQKDPMEAYWIESAPEGLRIKLLEWWSLHEMACTNGPAFLNHHAGKSSENPIKSCADVLRSNLWINSGKEDYNKYKSILHLLDKKTQAFFVPKPNGELLFPQPERGVEDLLKMHDEFQQEQRNTYSDLFTSAKPFSIEVFQTTPTDLISTPVSPVTQPKLSVPSPSPCFSQSGSNRWLYSKVMAGKENFLIFPFSASEATSNREFLASFRIVSNANIKIEVSFARYDPSVSYEGQKLQVKLTSGMPWSGVLKHCFRENHPNLKLQVEILECQSPTCILDFQEMTVNAVANDPSAQDLILSPGSFTKANKLYRKGKYAEALKIYEALQDQEPLSIYREIANITREKLSAS